MNTLISDENPDIFFDRELSWIDFNNRVLEEAEDNTNPILERLKFLCITESNLDEFFMVRVAGLKSVVASGNDAKRLNGMRHSEVIQVLYKKVSGLIKRQYDLLSNSILAGLKKQGIYIIERPDELTDNEVAYVKKYYQEEVSSILTPLAIDPSHPFPHILNKTLNLAITVCSTDDKSVTRESLAVVQVPSVLPRFLRLPEKGGERRFFPLEGIIQLHLSDLFYGMTVKEIYPFRITRDSDLEIGDDNKSDLLTSVMQEIKNRRWGDAVKLDIHSSLTGKIRNILKELINVDEHEIYEIPNLLNLNDLMFFYGIENTSGLKFDFKHPRNVLNLPSIDKIFKLIRKEDQVLHHPYDSFKEIESLLEFSSNDPKVLAIKMTLYRTSGDSPIITHLQQAAENGKQVTVLVELKARFDEERNIKWAKKLEDSGVHVVYGVVGLKIHCKMLLIVRRETDMLKRYVHLSTGNYNSTTAKYYTDISIITRDPNMTEDIVVLFNTLTSFAKIPKLSKVSAAPIYLKNDIIELIRTETENARNGLESRITMKMNSLVDSDVIIALYKASQAGVRINLIIRGICCLIPGIPGVSDNIEVRSIIGRYLEHSRIYIFYNNGDPKLFLTSADCMPRNFLKRVEIMFPILSERIKQKILRIIEIVLKDNIKARVLQPSGEYIRIQPGPDDEIVDSQNLLNYV